MGCRGAAHVPGPLIMAVVEGVGERHHSQLRGHPAATGSSRTGLGTRRERPPARPQYSWFVPNPAALGAEVGLGAGPTASETETQVGQEVSSRERRAHRNPPYEAGPRGRIAPGFAPRTPSTREGVREPIRGSVPVVGGRPLQDPVVAPR